VIVRKRFGQHFLHDEAVLDAIAQAVSVDPADLLLEIGPGSGALTAKFAGRPRRFVAIEIDRDLAPRLAQRFRDVEVVTGDAQRVELGPLLGNERWRVIGNLPYNVTSPLLLRFIGERARVQDMHFMVQSEVAERLAAQPGNKSWGRLTVMVQFHCTVEHLFDVGPESFSPRPRVWSAVVRITPREQHTRPDDTAAFERVVRLAFSQRRKRIGNALGELAIDFEAAGVDAGLRADVLAVADFIRLANCTGQGR
jgi:16S rRNA (adenine1518-N6/adenine1519-N6)-dimethyltransferase